MCNVIIGDPAEGGWRIVADAARDLCGVLWQMADHVGEKTVVCGPEIDEEIPVNFGEVLQIDERILIVAGKGQAALQSSADKALMVVRGRVEQVAEDFLFGPLPFARARGCVGVVQLHEQRFGLGHGTAEVGGNGGEWVHGIARIAENTKIDN